MPGVLIEWSDRDGAAHSERWPSVERFRAWAVAQGRRLTYTAYEDAPDEDGDLPLIERGQVG
jgi:hypothetical protein